MKYGAVRKFSRMRSLTPIFAPTINLKKINMTLTYNISFIIAVLSNVDKLPSFTLEELLF